MADEPVADEPVAEEPVADEPAPEPPKAPAASARRARLDAALLLPMAASVLVYSINFGDYWVSDDYDHQFLRGMSFADLWTMLTTPGRPGDFFRPLSRVSMALDYAVFGLHPEASHVINALLHGAIATMVTALTRQLGGTRRVAVLAGVLFALHPGHPEAVSFLGSRFDLVAAFFALASLLAYVRADHRGSRGWLAASVALFVAAIFSKESALLLPLAFAAYEGLAARARRWSRVAYSVACLAIYAVYRISVLGSSGAYVSPTGELRPIPHFGVDYVTDAALFTVYGLVTPINRELAGDYTLPLIVALAVPVVLVLAVSLFDPVSWRARAFAVLALIACLGPPSALFAPSGLLQNLEGSRYLYLPSALFSVALAFAFGALPRAWARSAMGAVIALYLVTCIAHAIPWSHGSRLARETIATILERCPGEDRTRPSILVFGPPDNVDGAFVWRNGLIAALQTLHPQNPHVFVERSEIPSDLPEHEQFDVREYARDGETCVFRWDAATEQLEDRTWVLGEVDRPSFDPDAEYPPITAWQVVNGRATETDGGVIVETDDPDPYLVSPPLPLGVAAVRFHLAVEASGEPSGPLFDAFWTLEGDPFDPAIHRRSFVIPPGPEGGEVTVGVPLGDPDELRATQLRIRIDPMAYPGRATITGLRYLGEFRTVPRDARPD